MGQVPRPYELSQDLHISASPVANRIANEVAVLMAT